MLAVKADSNASGSQRLCMTSPVLLPEPVLGLSGSLIRSVQQTMNACN